MATLHLRLTQFPSSLDFHKTHKRAARGEGIPVFQQGGSNSQHHCLVLNFYQNQLIRLHLQREAGKANMKQGRPGCRNTVEENVGV